MFFVFVKFILCDSEQVVFGDSKSIVAPDGIPLVEKYIKNLGFCKK